MASTGAFRQDMPPPGGYKQIPFERIPAKRLLKARPLIAAYFVIQGIGIYFYGVGKRSLNKLYAEARGARFALMPMIQAERDRAYLAQIRRNRDEEERLMANVPGWVVGTYYGEPVYKTRPNDEWYDITSTELFIHNDPWYGHHYNNFYKWV